MAMGEQCSELTSKHHELEHTICTPVIRHAPYPHVWTCRYSHIQHTQIGLTVTTKLKSQLLVW